MNYKYTPAVYIPAKYEVTTTRTIEVGKRFNMSPTYGIHVPRTVCTVTGIGTPEQIIAAVPTAAQEDWDSWRVEPEDKMDDTPFVLIKFLESPEDEEETQTALPLELFVDLISSL